MSRAARSGHELLVGAWLADSMPLIHACGPLTDNDRLDMAGNCIDSFKRKFPALWDDLLTHCKPCAAASVMVDVILSEVTK